MEDFIERSHALLSARPETARISMTYTHKNATSTSARGERVDASAKPAKVVFKAYCPHSGLCYKFKATKANELSRILASLSPHMFEFGTSRKRGIASVLSDTAPAEDLDSTTPTLTPCQSTTNNTPTTTIKVSTSAPTNTETAEPKSSKSKKKKGKKH